MSIAGTSYFKGQVKGQKIHTLYYEVEHDNVKVIKQHTWIVTVPVKSELPPLLKTPTTNHIHSLWCDMKKVRREC